MSCEPNNHSGVESMWKKPQKSDRAVFGGNFDAGKDLELVVKEML